MTKPTIAKRGKFWYLSVPAIKYTGGWSDWVTCMVGLTLYYANKNELADGFGDLNRLINRFINAHMYDGYYQYFLSDWNRIR